MSDDGTDRRGEGPQLSATGQRARAARDERLAAALRENLKRRKAQERGRATGPGQAEAAPRGPKDAEKGGRRPGGET